MIELMGFIIFSAILLGITCIGVFGIFSLVIMVWTGCKFNEAIVTLRNIVNNQDDGDFLTDSGFCTDIWNTVEKIIGENRFQKIVQLSETGINVPMLYFSKVSRLSCVQISVFYENENEKEILENMLLNVFKQYLQIYEYDQNVIIDWKIRRDLNMPYLEIRYARNEKEKRILNIIQSQRRKKLTIINDNPTDNMEGDELDG